MGGKKSIFCKSVVRIIRKNKKNKKKVYVQGTVELLNIYIFLKCYIYTHTYMSTYIHIYIYMQHV